MGQYNSDFKSVMATLVFTHFLIHTYSQLIPALLPTLKQELGVSLVQASLLISIPMMMNIIVNIPAGIISDRIEPNILAVCFLINIAGAVLITASNNFIVLIVGAGLISMASTFYHPPSLKTASLLDPEKINLAMAAHLAGGTSGIAIGPILLGILMPFFGWRLSFLVWIPFNLILSLLTYRLTRRIRYESMRESSFKGSILDGVRSFMTC